MFSRIAGTLRLSHLSNVRALCSWARRPRSCRGSTLVKVKTALRQKCWAGNAKHCWDQNCINMSGKYVYKSEILWIFASNVGRSEHVQ